MKKTAWIWALPLLLLGCGGEEASASTDEVEETSVAEAEPAQAGGGDEAEAGPLVEDPSFELRATAVGPYTAGTPGNFGIVLTPRGNYHVNEDYPMTVTLTAPEGVTLPSTELGNDDAEERSEARAAFDVPFTAENAGEHRVTALVDFAVCTPETCMPETRTLALLLPVE